MLRDRTNLALENFALRQQLAVFRRTVGRGFAIACAKTAARKPPCPSQQRVRIDSRARSAAAGDSNFFARSQSFAM